MKSMWIIARRELRSMFDHPTGYILLVVFVALNDFLFFRSAFLFGVATLRPMLEFLPWLMLLFVPAVTMGALAEDIRAGTIEVVLAQPVTELELLVGKYLGLVSFIWLGLALTLPIPLGLSLGADMPVGVVVAQYAGAALLAAGFAAIGMWASSLGRNQVTAFIVGVAVMFVFLLIGLPAVLMGAPPAIGAVLARLAIVTHFASIARGVIDLRDLVYFFSLTAIFLVLAYGALMGRKLAPRGRALARLRLGTAMLLVTLVVVNLFGRRIGGRLDLTPGKAYTLSPATKAILENLPDLVTIRFFVSSDNALPPEVALAKQPVNDLLADFRSAGGGNLRLVVLDPAKDPAIAEEAKSLGVLEVQFTVSRKSEFEVKKGYFGLTVQYADQHETIPAIQGTDDLEYRLASFIRGLTREGRSTVGLYLEPPPLGQQQAATYAGLEAALSENFDVRRVSLETDSLDPGDLAVLVLAGTPYAIADSVADKLARFFDGGGGALVMARGMEIQAVRDQMIATERSVGWNRMLQPFGVTIRNNMVFDLASNHPATMRGSFG
ncbi:MAG: Gldg family protein, partial [Gemmatimonadales bacterium]